jgi:hypothetical protein
VSVMAVSLQPSRERMGMGADSRRGGRREETCWLAEEEEGGELAEHGRASRPPLRSSRQDEDEDKVVRASFPVNFGAHRVGNERSYRWKSGAAQGIWTEFQASFHATPNTGIWVRILSLILYIQTRCNCILSHLN